MKTRGKGIFKEEWYSICSAHYEHNENCELCNKGMWVNVIKHKIGSFIYDHFPNIWRWYVNR